MLILRHMRETVRTLVREWAFLFRHIPQRAFRIFLFSYMVFCILALIELSDGTEPNMIDREITNWAYKQPAMRSRWAEILTKFGDGDVLRKATAAGVFLLFLLRRWSYVPALLIGVFGEMWITHEMQDLFGRVRPYFPDIPYNGRPGFHSGHTSSATAFFVFWILFFLLEYRDSRATRFLVPTFGLIVLGVGVTRVGLLAHWLTDVLAGFCFGVCWIMICFWINEKMQVQGRSPT